MVLTVLEDLIKDFPDSALLVSLVGNFHFMRRDFSKAETHYRQAIALEPDHIGSKRSLGVLLAGRGKGKEAEKYLREAAKTDPKGEQVVQFLNVFIFLSDRSAISIRAYETLEKIHLGDKEILSQHVAWLVAVDDPEAMLGPLEKLLKIEETTETLINFGATLCRMKREGDAIRPLTPGHRNRQKKLSGLP